MGVKLKSRMREIFKYGSVRGIMQFCNKLNLKEGVEMSTIQRKIKAKMPKFPIMTIYDYEAASELLTWLEFEESNDVKINRPTDSSEPIQDELPF